VELPSDLWPKRHRSYFVWEYDKPPDVVIEIVSNAAGGENAEKMQGYARIGVPYYVIYDPRQYLSDQVLRGFRKDGLGYRTMEQPLWLPGVDLSLQLWEGPYEGQQGTWLRWFDGDGSPIATGAERAEQEHQRALRLAEQLRRLGIEPEA
jgi:hypothetical protein